MKNGAFQEQGIADKIFINNKLGKTLRGENCSDIDFGRSLSGINLYKGMAICNVCIVCPHITVAALLLNLGDSLP